MPTSVENYIFGELPRRLVVDPTANTGTSLTAGWVIVATGNGFQAVPVNPSTLGFEPTVAPATGDPTTKYYRGDKTWQTLDAAAVGAIASSEKGTALGVATLDADGYVLLSQMNPSVVERVVIVADEAARYALTTLDVQNGDVVNQQSPLPATMWFVVDQNNLDSSAGYLPFSAGVAASVAWSGITGKPAIIDDLENISLAAEGDLIQFVAGNWVNVDVASLKADLALEITDIDLLQDALDAKQDQSTILDNLSAISTKGVVVRTSDWEFIGREVVGVNGIAVTEGKGDADNISLSLTEVGVAGTYGDDDNYPTYEVDAYGRVTSTTIKSLVKDTLTLLDQVADQTLVSNTTYQIGAYVETLNLLVPDPVVGGTKITLEVPPILGTPVGDINVSFPSGKELFGFVPSISLKSMMNPLPGDRITFTYIDNLSQWVVYKAPGLYLRELYLVGDSTANPTLEPSFFHSVASKATDSRVLSIPDRDVDLSSVGQTEFTSSEFSVIDPSDPSKKVAFSVGSVGAGNTSIITVPDSPVDLGDIGKVSPYLLPTATFTAIANRRYSLINAIGSIDITLPTTPTEGDTVEVYLAAIPANNTVRFLKSDKDFYFSGNPATSVQPNAGELASTYLWVFSVDSNCWIQNIHSLEGSFTSSNFTLRDTTSWNKIAKFNVSGLTSGSPRTITVPDTNVDLGKVAQAASTSVDGYLTAADWNTFNSKEFVDSAFRVSDNTDATKKIAFQASGIATGQERTITMPNADVDLGKVPTGVTPTYATGRLMVPLADGTSIPLSAFGGTRLANLNSPATVLAANGHYLFYSNTGSYYTVICALVLPTAPDDATYVRISNISSLDSFATGAGATVAPGGSDKINGVAATFSITDYLVNYRNAVITLTYSAFNKNWTVSVLGDLINPSTIAIYDADKTNSTTLTPVADLTANRVITLPDADVNLGKVPTNLAYNSATAVLTQTLTDSSSLSADLSATAVSQIVLTGSATVVVSATQPSTKYFLAGSSVSTFDVGAFTNTGRFIEIVNNRGSYANITLTATGKSFKDEVNDNVTMPIILVSGESVFVFPVSASVLQVYRNKPDIRNIKNNSNTVTSGFKTTNLFVDASFSLTGHLSANADEILRVFALSSATINFGANVYDARTDTQISTGSYTLYAGQVLEVTKTSASKWIILGGHIQDTSRFRLYNSSNVPTKFDTSAATAERTITMPDADVNLGALKSLNTLPVGVTNLAQLRAGHDYFVTQSGIILGIQTTSALGLYDTSIGYSFSNTTSSDLTVTVRWTAGTGTPGLVSHVDAISGSTIATALLTLTPTYDYVYTLSKGGTLRLLPNAASNVTILRSFNVNLGNVAVSVATTSLKMGGNSATSMSGAYNTVLGYGSATSLTSGTGNTIVGHAAAPTLTSSNNTIMGYLAGNLTTSSTRNTLIGSAAGYLSNATDRTCIGAESGGSCGECCVAVGSAANYGGTGKNTTSIGQGSGAYASGSSGEGWVAVGYQAAYHSVSAITASNWVTVGINSGQNQNTPDWVAIGANALRSSTARVNIGTVCIGTDTTRDSTNAYGVAIGYQAGYGTVANNRSDGDAYGIYIGFRASRDSTVAASTVLSDCLAIGRSATVSTSNTYILGSSSVGINVGICMITATARLHLPAGAAPAGKAPLKFTSGVLQTTAEAGAIEYNNAYYATASDAVRRPISLSNAAVLPSNITVTASPFTYQNTTAFNGDVIISGGTVSSIEFTRDNNSFYTTGLTTGVITLSPSDRVRVTYSVAPTMTLVPR